MSEPSMLRWETLSGVVCSALGGSHGNKTLRPRGIGRMGILGSWAVRSGSHSGMVYEEARGEERHVHTLIHSLTHSHNFHSNSQKPSVFLSCHITITLLCARLQSSPSVSPWQHLAQVKLILTGASWIGRIQPGRWEPDFQGMQLISIKTSRFRCD